jgi:hypothetical protein
MPDYLDPENIEQPPMMSLDQVEQSLSVQEAPPAPVSIESTSADAIMVPPDPANDDIIMISIRDDELPDAVLKAVLLGLADEQMALRNLRVKKEKENKDISHLSLKRGTLLKYMSETLIQRQALVGGTGEIDLKSPKFREVIKMFLQIIADTFDEVKIPSEYRDLFFHALSRKMDGWEMKAEKVLRNIR